MFSIFRQKNYLLSTLFGPHLDFIPYWPAFIKVKAFRTPPSSRLIHSEYGKDEK